MGKEIEPIVDIASLAKGQVDLTDPAQAHTVSQAIQKLGYCRETMAVLNQKLTGEPFADIRNNMQRQVED